MKGFNNRDFETYTEEAAEKWGETAQYKEHREKTRNYIQGKWNDLAEEMDHIMEDFAECMKMGESFASVKVQELVKTLQTHITENYYLCTEEILAGLGQMYVCDERFKKNIDKHGSGTAEFISMAIGVYCGI